MKKYRVMTVYCLIAAFLAGALSPSSAAQKKAPVYSKVVAFGDSYSDNGQALKISTEIVNGDTKVEGAYIKPGECYWNGRYSNGKTAVEILADKLNVPLENYATGGATTGETNYSSWMDANGNTGVLGQIRKFENSLEGKEADSSALYFIFASANDYFYHVDYEKPGKIEAVADEAVDNLKLAVRRLYKLGARRFMVVNSSDLSMVPYEIMMKRTKKAAAFMNYINKELPAELKKIEKTTKASITLFDITKVSRSVKKNPSEYGIKVLDQACQVTYPEAKKAKKNPETYYFWDEWHYTKAIHKLLGKKMQEQLLK